MKKRNIVTWEELEEGEIYYIERQLESEIVSYIAQYIELDHESKWPLKIFKLISKSENSVLMVRNDNNFPLSKSTVDAVCVIYKL